MSARRTLARAAVAGVAAEDRLKGVYYQAVIKQKFDVQFERR